MLVGVMYFILAGIMLLMLAFTVAIYVIKSIILLMLFIVRKIKNKRRINKIMKERLSW